MTKSLATKLQPSDDRKAHENVEKPIKPILTKIADHSVNKVTVFHYIGVGLWLGWFAFYAYLPIALVLFWMYCKPAFAVTVVFLVTAYLLPIDRELQPAVSTERYLL